MKKLIIMNLTAFFALSLAGCGNGGKKCKADEEYKDGKCQKIQEDSLVLYFINENEKKLILYSGTASAEAIKGECVAVQKSAVSALKASLEGVAEAVCDSSSANKCVASGNHKVNAEGKLEKADAPADTSKCKILAKNLDDDFYTIENHVSSPIKVSVAGLEIRLNPVTGGAAIRPRPTVSLSPAAPAKIECVKVKKSLLAKAVQGKKLKIVVDAIVDRTLCDTNSNNVSDRCPEGHLQVKSAILSRIPEQVSKPATPCTKELKE